MTNIKTKKEDNTINLKIEFDKKSPDTPKDNTINFEIIIDKKSPAVPGDKYISKVLSLDEKDSTKYVQLNQENNDKLLSIWYVRSNNKESKWSENDILSTSVPGKDKNEMWNGKILVSIIRPLNDFNLVPCSDFINQPKWNVKIKINKDGISAIDKPKTTGSDMDYPDAKPAITASSANESTPRIEPDSPEHKIRIDAVLSFDKERIYTVKPLKKWPQKIEYLDDYKKKEIYIYNIYQAIQNRDNQKISRLIDSRVLTCTVKRLSLDELKEGEWCLPICPTNSINKDEYLTYVKVKIAYTSGASQTSTPGSQTTTK
jgi:hypothetical protein